MIDFGEFIPDWKENVDFVGNWDDTHKMFYGVYFQNLPKGKNVVMIESNGLHTIVIDGEVFAENQLPTTLLSTCLSAVFTVKEPVQYEN